MKRFLSILVASGALAIPAAATADQVELRGTSDEPSVGFTAKIRDGDVIKVSKFRFYNITLACDGDSTTIVDNQSSPLPAMKVENDKFGDRFNSDGGQKVKVSGKFSKGGKVAEGHLQITGDFTGNGQALTNCDSGKVSWVAK